MKEDTTAIDQALADIVWIKGAPAQYTRLLRQIDLMRQNEPVLSAEAVAHFVEQRDLENQAEALLPVVADSRRFLDAALARLRSLNGVDSVHVVTRDLGNLALRRLSQGYSLAQVASMIGCAAATVASIKTGRYAYSDLPPQQKIGARGSRRRPV